MQRLSILLFTLMTLLLLSPLNTFGGGGKHRTASPVLPSGEVDCIYTVPDGIDLSSCALLTAPDQSQQAFICSALVPTEDSITVICTSARDYGSGGKSMVEELSPVGSNSLEAIANMDLKAFRLSEPATGDLSDEALTISMHKMRFEMTCLSDADRLESGKWLSNNGYSRMYNLEFPPAGSLPS